MPNLLEELDNAGIDRQDQVIVETDGIFVDFIDFNKDNVLRRLQRRKESGAEFVSAFRVNRGANHRMTSDEHPYGRKCNQSLNERGFVFIWKIG